eukprot:1187131-Rhodomonas_salina.1
MVDGVVAAAVVVVVLVVVDGVGGVGGLVFDRPYMRFGGRRRRESGRVCGGTREGKKNKGGSESGESE